MSVKDAEVLLNQETGLFVFIPVINHAYIYYAGEDTSYLLYIVAVLLLASFIYNLATGDPDRIPKSVRYTFVISVILWFGALLFSVFKLFSGVQNVDVFSIILFFSSLLFLMLLATDYLLDSVTNGYDMSL
jgi:hypothetical protein